MTTTRSLRYVAIGDSLSEGVGDEPWPDGTPRGWTDRLAAHLADHHEGVEYANLAIRGYRASQVLDGQVADAIAIAPDVVSVTAGMNDLLRPRVDFDALAATLVDIVRPFTNAGIAVVVVPIPDVREVSPVGGLIEGRRQRLNGIYHLLADQYGVRPLADTTGTVFEDRRGWADDRLHLSPLGHERLAMGAAAAVGLPVPDGWERPPDGPPPADTLGDRVAWVRAHVAPWLGRRLTGRSSGDDRVAKRPIPLWVEPVR